MEGPVIAVDGLVKRYDQVIALGGITFRIDRGEFTALLGSNGAGKSTLFDILMGFRHPSAGKVRLFGLDPFTLPESVKANIVFVPEEGAVPPWACANDIARLYRHLYPRFDAAVLRQMLDGWDIPPSTRVAELSKGERRLAEVALAMSSNPHLLLLDEPFSNLDVVMRLGVIDALRELHARTNATILYSTHILPDVEKTASRVVILRAGEIAVDKPVADLDEPVETLFVRHYGLSEAALPPSGGS